MPHLKLTKAMAQRLTKEQVKKTGFVQLREFRRLINLLYFYNELSGLFGQLDTNHDKRISFNEFKKGHELIGDEDIDEYALRKEFHRIDTNHGGYILFDEFCMYMAKKKARYEKRRVYFSINKLKQSDKQLTTQNQITRFNSIPISRQYDQRCHRGFLLHVWLNNDENLNTTACLCPAYSDSTRTLFALIISLTNDNNERIIHSYQQLTYIYVQHCPVKFNIYLLYSTRPKNATNNYFIHIDIYEKNSFRYRASLFAPVHFPFLPVSRIALEVNISRMRVFILVSLFIILYIDMETFFTKEQKLDFARRQFIEVKDDDENISWDNSLLIIKKIFGSHLSITKINNLLYDADQDSNDKISFDDFINVIKSLLLEENEMNTDADRSLPDEQQKQQQTDDFVQKLFELTDNGTKIDKQMMETLAQQYNIQKK
ncbi:unnamed protein product [Adineta steineri]|uniref:EF-hand domain-containing protein n=1 Tax=Adineta steineri TaxID=433720 RepID=A0A815P861_9BILA|nr:unnamed protein product [Adineta steineri]CAF1444960.1 unnamed protein product [Adineta steineri]CAF1445557.1 unnamed protein product [Adineta steineri]